jgi:putative nucleotidyltransferase with HDIG domain
MKTEKQHFIKPEQLRIGLYVHIDLGWMDHPFTFNNFKIKDEQQILEIRKLGLQQIRYDPLRSDDASLPTSIGSAAQESTASSTSLTESNAPIPAQPGTPLEDAGAQHGTDVDSDTHHLTFQQQRLQQLQQAIRDCEKKFTQTSSVVKQIEREILLTPPKSLHQAEDLVGNMVDTLLTEGEVVLHAMQPRSGMAEVYTHALNVTVLSLILAKSLDISADDIKALGLGALFHDIGKSQIPDRVTKKSEPFTKAELSLIQQHSSMGVKLAKEIGMPASAVRIIAQHHEYIDGSGFPAKLKNGEIDYLARIVAVANLYDNLCNPQNHIQIMTPYEALSHMFAHQRSKCDPDILKLLIKSLGVYPPGSLVKLSNDIFGIVVSVNPSKPLRPYVLLHAPDVPREAPLLVNLGEEAGLSITHCLRANQLPEDALKYLNPAERISYFFDKDVTAGE